MAKTYRLDLFIRPQSAVTESYALNYALDWANSRTNAEENKNTNGEIKNAYYVDITDLRTSKKFMVFGDVAHEIISGGTQMNQKQTILNTENFINGFSGKGIVDNKSGEIVIDFLNNEHKNYNVIASASDSLRAEIRIEDKSENRFKISLYDSQTFVEDNTKLDCSDKHVNIEYVVTFT